MAHRTGTKDASAGISVTGNGSQLAVMPVAQTAVLPPAQFRMVLMSFLAAGIGLLAGMVAYVLYKLIGLFTNLAFYHRWSTEFVSARFNHLGPWVVVTPVVEARADKFGDRKSTR